MYVLTLAFCGKNYHGWQSQENAVTIQRTVQDDGALRPDLALVLGGEAAVTSS